MNDFITTKEYIENNVKHNRGCKNQAKSRILVYPLNASNVGLINVIEYIMNIRSLSLSEDIKTLYLLFIFFV